MLNGSGASSLRRPVSGSSRAVMSRKRVLSVVGS